MNCLLTELVSSVDPIVINQGKVEKDIIPHSKPTLGTEESRAVAEVIESGYIAEGKIVKKFERAFAEFLGVEYAMSTGSGTSALHLTLLAMGVGPGDEVILPSYVCSALLNAVNYTGATPILAEISPATYNLDAADLKKHLSKRTRAIIVPHLFGLAADLESILALNVPIIEDCAQAVGTVYHRRPVGTFGQAAVFSFYATKVMTTGEGGMVVSNSRKIADRIRDLKSYDRKEYYKIRFNYKMTDIQAALGLVQLGRLEYFIRRRQAIAHKYSSTFSSYDLKLPPAENGHIYFRYVLGLNNNSIPWIQALSQMGIASDRPVHLPLHRYLNLQGYPLTEDAWRNSISIPIYPRLTKEEINRVVDGVTTCHKKFC
jgi:perosamine synthetase